MFPVQDFCTNMSVTDRDVGLLCRFVTEGGQIIPRRKTMICAKKQVACTPRFIFELCARALELGVPHLRSPATLTRVVRFLPRSGS